MDRMARDSNILDKVVVELKHQKMCANSMDSRSEHTLDTLHKRRMKTRWVYDDSLVDSHGMDRS